MGTRNHPSPAKDSIPASGDADRLEGWPGYDGETSQDQTEAGVARTGRKTRERAEGGQIRWMLRSNTGDVPIYTSILIYTNI